MNLFEHMHYSNFLSSSSDPMQLPGLLLSLTLMPKSKQTLEMSFNPTPSFKTSVDARIDGLVSNMDYLENRRHNLFKRNMAEKGVCHAHTFRFLDYNFSFCTKYLHR